ncbi:ABC transporter permease [Brevibacterium sp. 91QC2O2]|uniref:ABC transporter permease n=1 Tax=Brevibacterium sp. 91QC2O2 TaxID=2968458 RepID=UPI00211CC147|nr:ABC transporter permease [Brevibacterium sp. 91QC2O2]MCQ9368747.1 ABC transporter permease [Brevibacterium sp. 91QC2O2]
MTLQGIPESDIGRNQPAVSSSSRARRGKLPPFIVNYFSNPLSVIALCCFALIVIFAFIGPHLWKYQFDVFTSDNSAPPSPDHPFGTDSTGYDTLSQVMRGAQRSIQIALSVAIIATVLGALVGSLAGFYGGVVDSILMRTVDLVLVFPTIAVAAVLAFMTMGTQTSWWAIAIVLAALAWPIVARLVRSDALSIMQAEYISAARGLGASDWSIIIRHLIPNCMGTITVAVTVLTSTAILSETALSYLGFGVQSPDTSLGLLISQAQNAVSTRPWLFYFPGLFIILIALSTSFIGDGLRRALDPRQSRGGRA